MKKIILCILVIVFSHMICLAKETVIMGNYQTSKAGEKTTFNFGTRKLKANFADSIVITLRNPMPIEEFVVKTQDGKTEIVKLSSKSYSIKVKTPDQITAFKVTLSAKNSTPLDMEISKIEKPKSRRATDIALERIVSNYNLKENKATFVFDEKYQIKGPAPVNVDADDEIIVKFIVLESEKPLHKIKITGDYNPSDLSFVPSESILGGEAQLFTDAQNDKMVVITSTFHPYTTENITIVITKEEEDPDDPLATIDTPKVQYTVRINKLYHLAVGVSFISTNLQKPSFVLEPLSATTNTINKIDNSSRSMAMVNVVFYWSTLKQKIADRSITRGRDIMKEASFWERINPTFGVPISKEWDKNMFFGLTYEFSRGGSVIFGGHYGDVKQMADQNFKLGEDEFSGTKDDIQLSTVYRWGPFIGISLDTRIVNVLFPK